MSMLRSSSSVDKVACFGALACPGEKLPFLWVQIPSQKAIHPVRTQKIPKHLLIGDVKKDHSRPLKATSNRVKSYKHRPEKKKKTSVSKVLRHALSCFAAFRSQAFGFGRLVANIWRHIRKQENASSNGK